ncbi:MAG: hypothetical protein CME70_16075 [Halobacteriovorax sp.]|nr:hypothetical protein [Halobacteriovorax sp.]|tara:strand:+ start:78251 stop:79126 length:876 start_codon:yes stop_codon:yes gene_type:complete
MPNLLILFLLLTPHLANSKEFKFQYSNDFFTGSDQYFTQGIEFKHVSDYGDILPSKVPFIDSQIILKNSHALEFHYMGFTPKDPYSPLIQSGDRPFANSLYFTGVTQSRLKVRNVVLESKIDFGFIGKMTGGEFIHKSIHKATNNKTPRGWDNQIRNDVIINYTLMGYYPFYDSKLLNLGLGSSISFGTYKINTRHFSKIVFTPFTFLEVYLIPSFSNIFYDATLQGGIFDKKSPHKVARRDIQNYTYDLVSGIKIKSKSFHIAYDQTWKSKEFSGADAHAWGRVSLNFLF